jgi:ElaA protein
MSGDEGAGSLDVRIARGGELPACLEVRRRVFVDEIGVDTAHEVDGKDEHATHWIARIDGRCIGTARLRIVDGRAKAERVAVLGDVRGLRVGAALMAALEANAAARGFDHVELHAQLTAVPFYLANGYQPTGEPFIEADIPHQAMLKGIPAHP